MKNEPAVAVSPLVAAAIASGQPVVALESTVYSTLGLPVPHNREVFDACNQLITSGGATPALTAVINGPHRIDDPAEIADVLRHRRALR